MRRRQSWLVLVQKFSRTILFAHFSLISNWFPKLVVSLWKKSTDMPSLPKLYRLLYDAIIAEIIHTACSNFFHTKIFTCKVANYVKSPAIELAAERKFFKYFFKIPVILCIKVVKTSEVTQVENMWKLWQRKISAVEATFYGSNVIRNSAAENLRPHLISIKKSKELSWILKQLFWKAKINRNKAKILRLHFHQQIWAVSSQIAVRAASLAPPLQLQRQLTLSKAQPTPSNVTKDKLGKCRPHEFIIHKLGLMRILMCELCNKEQKRD